MLGPMSIHTIGNNAKNATITTVDRKPEINPVTTGPSFSTINIKNALTCIAIGLDI
jgi:hypothetical protein